MWAAGLRWVVTSSFRDALEACVASIPRGKVATCGTVARTLGDVRAARSVATWLVEYPDAPGSHRVVRADGQPVLRAAEEALVSDGVRLRDGRVDFNRFVDALKGPHLLETLRNEQQDLAARVSERDEPTPPRTLGGVDVAYAADRAFAVAVRVDATTLETLEVVDCEVTADFPYIPTYLAFREFPAVRAALDGLAEKPGLLFVDGHGRLHPALFGFACFVGVQLDVPTVGIAKHPLAGRPVPTQRTSGGATAIELDGVLRGYAWSPPAASRPFYVSVGHRVSLPTALLAAQRATRRRYPEPLLVADRLSKQKRDEKNTKGSASGRTTPARPPAQGREGV